MTDDTIFALSSGRGIAGVAVIRVSGPASKACLERLGGRLPPARQAALRTFREPLTDEPIDRGLALWFPGPASFTGEDVAEFHVHGSDAVIAAMVEALRRTARPAEAGEFTRRAFRNGRLDLVEAEGLADLLSARTARQRRQALHHMSGSPSRGFEAWRSELIAILARVEAAVDFSDEADVASAALAGVLGRCAALRDAMRDALAHAGEGEAVRDGISVVLAGLPNTGKSTLLNALARRDVAITSPQPGTTRDVVVAEIELAGVPIRLSDTAGLRDAATDDIEIEGMARTRRSMARADIVLWVSAPDIPGSNIVDSEAIWIENKSDLPLSQSSRLRNDPDFAVSARTGAGMAELLAGLTVKVEAICGHSEGSLIVRARQAQCISECVSALDRALGIGDGPIELLSENLRAAAHSLGRLTGRVEVEDLLDSIFKSFCIGK